MRKMITVLSLVSILYTPMTAFAENAVGWGKLNNLSDEVTCIANLYSNHRFKLSTAKLNETGIVTKLIEENGFKGVMLITATASETEGEPVKIDITFSGMNPAEYVIMLSQAIQSVTSQYLIPAAASAALSEVVSEAETTTETFNPDIHF